jgi:hypothetical protein
LHFSSLDLHFASQVLICTLQVLISIFRPILIFDQFRPELDGNMLFLPASLARQPGLDRQPCPPALPASLARLPCPAALPGSLAPAALHDSLARQSCPADNLQFAICNFILIFDFDLISIFRPISTNFDQFRPDLLISIFTSSLLLFPQFKDVAMLSLVYELISTCERG